MKYVRTKNRIREYEKSIKAIRFCGKDHHESNYLIRKDIKEFENSIIKQADTIEELCDCFVMFCPNAIRRKIRVYETMRSISLYSKRDKRWNGNMVDKVYGAIWTDKGLIYVAKINEKGELELL